MRWLVLLAMGCGSTEECMEGELLNAYGECVAFDGAADEPFEPNNHAVLQGDLFPEGGAHDPSLVRIVPYEVEGGWSNVELGALTVTRPRSTSDLVWITLPATNQGQPLCFLSLGIELFDADGGFLGDVDGTYLQGSVFDLDVVHTDSCLGTGEQGWFLTLEDAAFDEIASALVVTDDAETDGRLSDARVIPTSYTVTGSDLSVEASHEAGPVLESELGGKAVVLDASGAPIYWEFLDLVGATIEPGASATFEGSGLDLEVAGSTLDIRFDFEPIGVRRAAVAPPLDPVERVRQRDDRERAKHRSASSVRAH